MNDYDLDDKFATARTRLILDKPFLGALVLRLPMIEADPSWCDSTFSDGLNLYYNAAYMDALNDDQTQFVLSNEALHCALSHFARRGHRVKHRWEMACDFAVNPLLIKDGLTPPPGVLNLREYDGMTAEEIYPCLDDNDNSGERDLEQNRNDNSQGSDNNPEQSDGSNDGDRESERQDLSNGAGQQNNSSEKQGKNNGAPAPSPMSPQELDQLSEQWQQRMAGAAQSAMQSGKLQGEMARMIDFLLQPRLPWRMLLARYMTSTARDDYSYARPSSRRGDPAIYPSLRSNETRVVVALDVSGSISSDEIQEFISEIDAIKSQVRAKITLLACDSGLAYDSPWYFEPWDEFSLDIDIRGGGGTDFRPVFEWVKEQDSDPDALIYFTDAEGVFPEAEAFYPVIWLVKGKTPVPWGQRIQLN